MPISTLRLALLTLATGILLPPSPGRGAPQHRVLDHPEDWSQVDLDNLRIDGDTLVVNDVNRPGTLNFIVGRGLLPFRKAIPFFSVQTHGGANFILWVRPRYPRKAPGPWMRMATWARGRIARNCKPDWVPPDRRNYGSKGPPAGAEAWVQDDTLVLRRPARVLEVKAVLEQFRSPQLATIEQVGVTFVPVLDFDLDRIDTRSWNTTGEPHVLDVEFRSQMSQIPPLRRRACGPVALGMILAFHGIDRSTRCLAQLAYDSEHDIFGNWTFLAATAGELGLKGEVAYLKGPDPQFGLEDLYKEIRMGRPFIMAIRYRKGALKGAPMPSTPGHLVVVRGYDSAGNFIVNDPAGRDAIEGRVLYDRDEMIAAWKSGVIIRIRPATHSTLEHREL